jgi:hypothetical protein
VRRNENVGEFSHPQKRKASFVLSGMRQRKSKNVEPRQPGEIFGSAAEERMRYQRDPYMAEIRAAHRAGASVWAIARALGMGEKTIREIVRV